MEQASSDHAIPGDVQVLGEGKYIRLLKKGQWEFATRRGVSGIVGLVALTSEGKLLLVEQERPAVGAKVIELPAGLAGDQKGHETEELSSAAQRELLEETGYSARSMKYLAQGAASAGLSDEVITLFFAEGLEKVAAAGGDGSEQITLHEVALADVMDFLQDRQGEGMIVDLKVYAGLYFALMHQPSNG